MGTQRTVRKEERELLNLQSHGERKMDLREMADQPTTVHQQACQFRRGDSGKMKRYVQSDLTKLAILELCKTPLNAYEISERIGHSRASISQHMRELGNHILIDTSVSPWRYKANPKLTFTPKVAPTAEELRKLKAEAALDESLPILPQGPLSFLSEYQRYTPPVGRHVEERHATWIGRSDGAHIGNGSCALMEMAG
ncbi:MAG TPA: winged helix-turn-helix domain-containing protein [Methylophilaceae bacterium]|nr:winged helix-turn-helix domain-containing protein [Methylophilaceae bacterium]